MQNSLEIQQVNNFGISNALEITDLVNQQLQKKSPEQAWQFIAKHILQPTMPFQFHLLLFSLCYPNWQNAPYQAASFIPDPEFIATTHLGRWLTELNLTSRVAFHQWSVENRSTFWAEIVKRLSIAFMQQPEKIIDLTQGVAHPKWLINAKFNIVESCFQAPPTHVAVIEKDPHHSLRAFSYAELQQFVNRIANSLVYCGFAPHDAIAIDMPMNYTAIAIYLGIIKMGGVVVSIADSFSADEILTRLRITQAKGIFTQDILVRGQKKLPLYEKVVAANAPLAIVLSATDTLACSLRSNDIAWENFLLEDDHFVPTACQAMTPCNILFSSGTTGDPKAIPWLHVTAIKAASDAYLHHNIHPDDILAWPTNLGWMMGPWLIFAALINQATLALYTDLPHERAFGEFIQDAKVTMLGVVPTLVASWRQSHCMEGLDWQQLRLFSSTGECSNPEDMLYLMSLAGYPPILEYCGGTEIGGAYLSSTLIENNYPSVFTTPTMGLDFVLLDEAGHATDKGEVALIPPSIGLSTTLLNADHDKVYFADMPLSPDGKTLRRHGDQVQRFPNDTYCVLGRVDDTMNLGGIKISSAEIERVLSNIENIIETAAIAVNLNQFGPSHLVIYAATRQVIDKEMLKIDMQKRINQHLNPLFKIHDVVLLNELPKTASNKIMRRVLRKQYSS